MLETDTHNATSRLAPQSDREDDAGVRRPARRLQLARRAEEAASAVTRPLVLDDVVLLDGTGEPPRPSARVVVHGGVIVSVGRASDPPEGGTVIDGRGRWLLPGMWDTHIHSVFSAGGCVWPEEFSEHQRLGNWRAYLRNGITSVVSVADELDLVLAARAAERDGDLTAPRVFAAGPALTAPRRPSGHDDPSR